MTTNPATKVAEPILIDEQIEGVIESLNWALDQNEVDDMIRFTRAIELEIRAALGRAEGPSEPVLVLALPDYETRRIVIASDEVIDGERIVCVAIEDAVAPSDAIEARTERIRLSHANSDSKGKIQLRHEVECLLAHIALLRSALAASDSAQPASDEMPDLPYPYQRSSTSQRDLYAAEQVRNYACNCVRVALKNVATAAATVTGPSTLAQQVARAQNEMATWSPELRASVRLEGGDTVTGAQAGASDDARDAARYRWLQKNHSISTGLAGCEAEPRRISVVRLPMLEGASLDGAVDAAIKAMAPVGVKPKQAQKPLTSCAAHQDGECYHQQCPQLRDNEPAKSGRHCPIAT